MMKIGERYLWKDKALPVHWAVVEITGKYNLAKCLISFPKFWRVGSPLKFSANDEKENLTLIRNQDKPL